MLQVVLSIVILLRGRHKNSLFLDLSTTAIPDGSLFGHNVNLLLLSENGLLFSILKGGRGQ